MTKENFFDDPAMTKYVMQQYGMTKTRAQKFVIELNKLNFVTGNNMTIDELFETLNQSYHKV